MLQVQRESAVHECFRQLFGELVTVKKSPAQILDCPVLQRILNDLLIFWLTVKKETICSDDELSRNLWRSGHGCWLFGSWIRPYWRCDLLKLYLNSLCR
jgi:hypothetical protein